MQDDLTEEIKCDDLKVISLDLSLVNKYDQRILSHLKQQLKSFEIQSHLSTRTQPDRICKNFNDQGQQL